MENIYNSHFQRIMFDSDLSLMKIAWVNTEKLRNELYKNELIEQMHLIERFKPKRIFFDTSTFVFVIIPEVQEWNNEHIMPAVIKAGVRNVAILITADLFVQVSIEQNMEEETTEAFCTRYFENPDEALLWLKNSK